MKTLPISEQIRVLSELKESINKIVLENECVTAVYLSKIFMTEDLDLDETAVAIYFIADDVTEIKSTSILESADVHLLNLDGIHYGVNVVDSETTDDMLKYLKRSCQILYKAE